jgi:hypothetical protein
MAVQPALRRGAETAAEKAPQRALVHPCEPGQLMGAKFRSIRQREPIKAGRTRVGETRGPHQVKYVRRRPFLSKNLGYFLGNPDARRFFAWWWVRKKGATLKPRLSQIQ